MTATVERVHLKPKITGEHGIPKLPVPSAEIVREGLVGDFNHYRTARKKRDPDMAVLILPAEVLDELLGEGWPVGAGDLGENLLTRGLPNDEIAVDQFFRVGPNAVLQISRACDPCSTLRVLAYVGAERLKAFMQTTLRRRGFYARVIEPGLVTVGDRIERSTG